MAPFVDGDILPQKSFLITAEVILYLRVEEGTPKPYDNKHRLRILEIIPVSNVRDIGMIAQRLLLTEVLKLNLDIARMKFSIVEIREISKESLKTATTHSRSLRDISIKESPLVSCL